MVSTLPHERTPQAPIRNGPEHAIYQAGEKRKEEERDDWGDVNEMRQAMTG